MVNEAAKELDCMLRRCSDAISGWSVLRTGRAVPPPNGCIFAYHGELSWGDCVVLAMFLADESVAGLLRRANDFYRILTEPENNMIRQQQVRPTCALLSLLLLPSSKTTAFGQA